MDGRMYDQGWSAVVDDTKLDGDEFRYENTVNWISRSSMTSDIDLTGVREASIVLEKWEQGEVSLGTHAIMTTAQRN